MWPGQAGDDAGGGRLARRGGQFSAVWEPLVTGFDIDIDIPR
ncbi:hypothetical protein [Sphaerisporangium sp. TRM90804]|nr:hypothetical protein [Sphaerisporangium sp. TRM90804]MDH2429261.1 hypothetical protein [Sphaerisporangium sp. TRM90804]